MKPRLHAATVIASLLFATLPVAYGSTRGAMPDDCACDDNQRVVAIADVHGAHDAMQQTLQQAGILGDDYGWIGGGDVLVVAGDILDRGPDSRAAMETLMRLESEAAAAGGRVHVLLGNHESMLLIGDMRYVSKAEYEAFAADESDAERDDWLARYAARAGKPPTELRDKFDLQYPRGYFAMRRAFRADGRYGAWLLSKDAVALHNGTAFVHGGLSPNVARLGVDALNSRIRQTLRTYVEALATLNDAGIILPTDSHYNYDKILASEAAAANQDPAIVAAAAALRGVVDDELLSSDGPLWYRRNVTCPAALERQNLDGVLRALGAERLVVGHTPTPNRQVLQRFDGGLVEIDTGMLNFYYKGMGSALAIDAEGLSVIRQDGAVLDAPLVHERRVGVRPAGLDLSQLEELLRSAPVAGVDEQPATESRPWNRTVVRLQSGDTTVNAVFHERESKGVFPGIASYRLDRLLRFDVVPVTVRRSIDGRDGSLQYLPPKTVDEATRVRQEKGGYALCPLTEQWAAMQVFDVLANLPRRSAAEVHYDSSTWQLLLAPNTRAFASRRPDAKAVRQLEDLGVSNWKLMLQKLDDDTINSEFSDVLDRRRLKALRSRRDQLLRL